MKRVLRTVVWPVLTASWASGLVLAVEPPVPASPDPVRAEFLAIARRLQSGDNPYLGQNQIPRIRQALSASDITALQEIRLRIHLSAHLLRLGDAEAAVREVQRCFELADADPTFDPRRRPAMLQVRALTWLRQAELNNCVRRHNRDCCIFPLRGGGLHSDAQPAREARRAYLAYLAQRPNDLAARWLVNICSMAIGDYPHGVPDGVRIPPQAFASEHDAGLFVDVAAAYGVDTFNQCGGVAIDDFDGNGWLDIVTSTFDPAGPLTAYYNHGGRFEPVGAAVGLDTQLGGLNLVAADYDADGDVDLLVLRGAWLQQDGRIRNSLLRNTGNGTFEDVTAQAGLAQPAYPTQAAAWGDYDQDGDLDVYVCNESRTDFTDSAKGAFPSQLYRNDGNGTFTDVAALAGVTNDRLCKGVTAGDFDNDGDLDIYASNIGPNRLYRNQGDGTFVDVAASLGVSAPTGRSFASWFFDYDNDGWLDLFVAAYDTDIADVAAAHLGLPHDGQPPRLYRNKHGRFEDVTAAVGLLHPWLPMGANFGDIDNDGYLDIYLGTGDPDYRSLMPNVLLRNAEGRRFQNITTSSGMGHLQKGHGVAFADLDHDGDQDIYHQLGGFYPGDRFRNALFANPGHGRRFVLVECRTASGGCSPIGARLTLTVRTPAGLRKIHRALGSVSSFGGSPQQLHIGLGDALAIESLHVSWPNQRGEQTFGVVPLDQKIRVSEGRQAIEVVWRQRFQLVP